MPSFQLQAQIFQVQLIYDVLRSNVTEGVKGSEVHDLAPSLGPKAPPVFADFARTTLAKDRRARLCKC